MNRTAECCCGQASIELQGEPTIHLVCHCDNCKSRTGSAFGMSAYFADLQIVRKQGETAIYEIDTSAASLLSAMWYHPVLEDLAIRRDPGPLRHDWDRGRLLCDTTVAGPDLECL